MKIHKYIYFNILNIIKYKKLFIEKNIFIKNTKNNINNFIKTNNIDTYIGFINNYNNNYIYKLLSKTYNIENYVINTSKYIILINFNKIPNIYIELYSNILRNKQLKKIINKLNFKNIINTNNISILKTNINNINTNNIFKNKYIINSLCKTNILKKNKYSNLLIITINTKIIKYNYVY